MTLVQRFPLRHGQMDDTAGRRDHLGRRLVHLHFGNELACSDRLALGDEPGGDDPLRVRLAVRELWEAHVDHEEADQRVTAWMAARMRSGVGRTACSSALA